MTYTITQKFAGVYEIIGQWPLQVGEYLFSQFVPGPVVRAQVSLTQWPHTYNLTNISGPLPDGDYKVTAI